MWQLSLKLHFEPDDQLRAVAPEDRWCFDPTDIQEFVASASSSSALDALAGRTASRVELTLAAV